MKKVVMIMFVVSLFPRLLVAQEFDLTALAGESWYGLYMGGVKSGFSVNRLSVEEDGSVLIFEDAQFRITQAGLKQNMRFVQTRTYGHAGDLQKIVSHVEDVTGRTEFTAVIDGGELVLTSVVGGDTKTRHFPKPNESLRDALKQVQLAGPGAKIGDEVTYSQFDPTFEKEITGKSKIIGVEDRVLNGVATKVFKVKSVLDLMPIETISYVAEDGTVLEDIVGGIITMRLEPEEMAKDVNYSNDVIIANAALIDSPIENPRERENLRLLIQGPLTSDHLFNDERQYIVAEGDDFLFTSQRISLDGLPPATIPIEEPSVQQWLEPTTFIQSDNPKLIAKATEIVGDEKDAVKASEKLCQWVYDHVRTTYSARLSNALEVLGSLEGDCTEHSVLFIGLARAVGLPAREVAGLIYVPGSQAGFYFHQWATVWVGKWIDVDPTFNQPFADVTHIKLAEGDLFTQSKLIPVIGKIKIQVLDETGKSE